MIVCAWTVVFSRSADAGWDSHTNPAGEVRQETAAGGATATPPLPGSPDAASPVAPGAVIEVMNGVHLGMAVIAPLVLLWLWSADVIRPGSFGRRGLRRVDGWPWWFWFLSAVLAFVAAGVGGAMAADLLRAAASAPSDLAVDAAQTVGAMVLGIAAAVLIVLVLQQAVDERKAGLVLRTRRRDWVLGLVALAAVMPVMQAASILSILLYQMVTRSQPEAISHGTLETLYREPGNPLVWVLVAGAVLGAPIFEELVFRGFLQTSVLRLTGRPWAAILITSVLFALAHTGEGSVTFANWHALLALVVLSVAIGVAYEWTKRLWVPVIMHMGFNAFNVALVVLGAV
jgi:uncharacterized protein